MKKPVERPAFFIYGIIHTLLFNMCYNVMRIILLGLLFSIFSCQQKSDSIEKIEIKYLSNNIESPIKIECNAFEEHFGLGIKNKLIVNHQKLKIFNKFLKEMHTDTSGYLPDVRAKLIIFQSKSIDTLCLNGGYNASFNGKSMIVTEGFMNFINALK